MEQVHSLQRLREMLEASGYVDRLTDQLYREMQDSFDVSETSRIEYLSTA